jgi:hypothetical protein
MKPKMTHRTTCTAGPNGSRCLQPDCLACELVTESEAEEYAEAMSHLEDYIRRSQAALPLTPTCPVCGREGAPEPYDICHECGWERDAAAEADPDDYVGGPNHQTLNDARANYAQIGAVTEHWAKFNWVVREDA